MASSIMMILAVLQVASAPLSYNPNVRYRFVTSQEEGRPVAVCDRQFLCHCPTGYTAVIQQSPVSPEATTVMCQPTATSSEQPRETFDSYPALPRQENFGQ